MSVQTQTFSQIVARWTAAAQSVATAVLDFSVGSVFLAIAEAAAGVGLWLQALCLQVLALTRAATSQGMDLDTWMADFGLTRLAGSPALGTVTFARASATLQAVVPIGEQVATSDGSILFAVIIDITNPAYNAGLGGYVLPISTTSVNVPVQALVAGSAGNVNAGTVTEILQPIVAVDTVTNSAAFSSGTDPETDAEFRARFVLYLGSLASADIAAVENAIVSVQAGLRFNIVEFEAYPALTPKPGYFFVLIDDGSGSPPSPLLTAVYNAINRIRAAGIAFDVYGPTAITVSVVMTVTVAAGANHTTIAAAIVTAVKAYIGSLSFGVTIPVTKIAQIAYDTSPSVTNVPLSTILLNGSNADLVLTSLEVPIAGTVTVN